MAALASLAPACSTLHEPAIPSLRVDSAAVDAEQEAESTAPTCLRPPRPLSDDGVFYVLGEDAAYPRVRYLDGQVSLNGACAIRRGAKLNRRIPPVYVNGRPIGFC